MTRETLTIDRLGQKGDGVAEASWGAVFVAGALPGEVVEAEIEGERGRLVAVSSPSRLRVTPPCPLFGTCGGCAVQHLEASAYAAWKREAVATALRQAGIEAEVAPLLPAHGGGRRRVTFHVRPGDPGAEPHVGFMEARSHRIVVVAHCPLLVPELERAPAVAKALAKALSVARKPLDVQVTATLGGLDVDVRGHGPASAQKRRVLADLAVSLGLARLALHGDVIVELQSPTVTMGSAEVVVPAGGFLQATAAGESTLASLVTEAVGGAKSIADLFAGVGPFALRLARSATVRAVESDDAALAALDVAARHARGLRTVTTETRDLFRRPLVGPELAGFDAVVMDPPRAGAEAQARALAASTVPLVVSVSCSAATFARDARILLDGGYTLDRVTPVDQFLYSTHVEIVGVFRRATPSRKPGRPRRLLG